MKPLTQLYFHISIQDNCPPNEDAKLLSTFEDVAKNRLKLPETVLFYELVPYIKHLPLSLIQEHGLQFFLKVKIIFRDFHTTVFHN